MHHQFGGTGRELTQHHVEPRVEPCAPLERDADEMIGAARRGASGRGGDPRRADHRAVQLCGGVKGEPPRRLERAAQHESVPRRHARHRAAHTGQRVRMTVRIDMRRRDACRAERRELGFALGFHVRGVHRAEQGAPYERRQREEPSGARIGERRCRGERRTHEYVEVQPHIEGRRRARRADAVLPAGLRDHHRGRRHGAGGVRLEDPLRDGGREREVVGVDDQPPRATGDVSRTSPGSRSAAPAAVRRPS